MPPSRAVRQPVVWEPVLDEVADRLTPVTVYGDLGRRRRVVIKLPDGHRLTPAGRLQRRQPRLWDCSVRLAVLHAVHAVHADLRARAFAGDGEALAPLRRAVPQEPGLTDEQVLTIPVDRSSRRNLESPFDHKTWAAAWAWFGGDPE